MSPVDFKKWPCRPVKFKVQGPLYSQGIGALDPYIRLRDIKVT